MSNDLAAALRTLRPPGASGLSFVRVYAGDDGFSHIETIDPRQAEEKLPYIFRAKAVSVALLTFPAGMVWDWHHTHHGVRRLLVTLRGLCVTIVNDGCEPGRSYHPLMPGSVMLAEDFSGRGHRGHVFAESDTIVFQVDLAG